MRYILPASLAAFMASTALIAPASAQTATSADFTGPRIGVLGGYDTIRPGSSEDTDVEGDDQSADGFLYGVELGYDVAVGDRMVIGAEAELTDSTGETDADPTDPNYFGYGDVNVGRDIYVGARVGYVVAPQTLLYAKGGYTNAKLDAQLVDGSSADDAGFKLDGWRVGAGVERKFGTNVYGKLEYRYSNYEDAKFEYDTGASTGSFDVDTDRHQVLVGVGYRF